MFSARIKECVAVALQSTAFIVVFLAVVNIGSQTDQLLEEGQHVGDPKIAEELPELVFVSSLPLLWGIS